MLWRYLPLLLFATPGLAATVPVQKEFRDWVVTCDNLRSCVAEGVDQESSTLIVRFSRDAGARGSASLAVYGMAGDTNPIQLQMDGKPLRLTKGDWYSDGTDEDLSFETDSQGEIRTLIDAVRTGHRLASGDASASLDGLSAALLLIDDVQGRIGTDTAWIRRGPESADKVPAAPAAPIVIAGPYKGPIMSDSQRAGVVGAAVAMSQTGDNPCDVEVSERKDAQAERLTQTDALVLVECFRGAYQSSFYLYRVPIAHPDQARQIMLPSIPGRPPFDMVTAAEFDPATGTLSHAAKTRGLGDCGETAQWRFDGHDFVLTAMSSQIRCLGLWREYPVLWRSH
jgi:hypothetical protein